MANWQGHGPHPTGHNTSEVDWGGDDSNPNHMMSPCSLKLIGST